MPYFGNVWVSYLIRLLQPNKYPKGLTVCGDPGWLLESRGIQDEWPEGMQYRAFYDPDSGIEFLHPEFFCDRQTLIQYLKKFIAEYRIKYPEQAAEIAELEALIKNQ